MRCKRERRRRPFVVSWVIAEILTHPRLDVSTVVNTRQRRCDAGRLELDRRERGEPAGLVGGGRDERRAVVGEVRRKTGNWDNLLRDYVPSTSQVFVVRLLTSRVADE